MVLVFSLLRNLRNLGRGFGASFSTVFVLVLLTKYSKTPDPQITQVTEMRLVRRVAKLDGIQRIARGIRIA